MGIRSAQHRSWTGKSAVLEANKLVDPKANFPAGGLVGRYVHPDAGSEFVDGPEGERRVLRFRIVKNTKTELFTDPADGDMTAHAKAGATYKTTGLFTVEKLGNRWWFITPEGNAFVVLSVSVIARAPRDGEDRTGKGYRHYVPLKYGGKNGDPKWVRNWARATLGRLRSWGFNTIGTFSYDVQREKVMSYYVTLRLSNYSVIKDGPCGNVLDGVAGGMFPDIYSPKFLPFIDAQMKRFGRFKDDPWVLGLFPDQMDELRGFSGGHTHLGWAALVGRKEIKNGNRKTTVKHKNYYKAEFIAFLQKRYEKIDALDEAWGMALASFESLWDVTPDGKFGLARDPKIEGKPKFREDLDAFEEKVAADYTRAIRATVNKYDPNHLLFSPNMGSPKQTIIRGFIKAGGYDAYFAHWGGKEYDQIRRPIIGTGGGFLTAGSDSPLRFEGDIERVEVVQHERYKELIKVWDHDADFWWNHRGNVLKIRFPGVPAPRSSITNPWNFQLVGTGKDEDGKHFFLARSGGGFRAGHPAELAAEIKKILEAGKKARYERTTFGNCKDQPDRARKWAEGMNAIATDRSPGGDYFRLGRNWWKLSDNGWTYWLERYNFGLVTIKDNAYDGKEATKLGADGKAGTWDDEERDYGDLLSEMTRANKGLYELILIHDAKTAAGKGDGRKN